MIREIKIENTFGIKEFEANFVVKGVSTSKALGIEEQLALVNNEYIAMTPTFLAKNAAGKTSFIKSIDIASRFSNRDNFISYMTFCITDGIIKEMVKADKASATNTGRFIDNLLDPDFSIEGFGQSKFAVSKSVITRMFSEISMNGSDFSNIYIDYGNKQLFEIRLTENEIILKYNKKTHALSGIIDEVSFNPRGFALSEIRKEVQSRVTKVASVIKFIKGSNVQPIYNDVSSAQKANKARVYAPMLKGLVNEYGFEAIKTLLVKVDDSIERIEEDSESKTLEIYRKGSSFPIAPKQLSYGTRKVIEILYKAINLFENGGVMAVDEIENGLHLSLIKLIMEFFAAEDINKSNAQIIITTHNPLIISEEIVSKRNVFMYENDKFVKVQDLPFYERVSDLDSFVLPKNYYNEYFWEAKKASRKATISPIVIEHIINSFERRA